MINNDAPWAWRVSLILSWLSEYCSFELFVVWKEKSGGGRGWYEYFVSMQDVGLAAVVESMLIAITDKRRCQL